MCTQLTHIDTIPLSPALQPNMLESSIASMHVFLHEYVTCRWLVVILYQLLVLPFFRTHRLLTFYKKMVDKTVLPCRHIETALNRQLPSGLVLPSGIS